MDTGKLFSLIDEHFMTKLEYPRLFAESERQVEGWFKGELIYLFSSLKAGGLLSSWEPEALVPGLGKKKTDFKVTLDDGLVYVEIKALYHGWQRGQRVDLGIYFYKDDVGMWGDVVKLASLQDAFGFCLLFVYPRPERDRWDKVIDAYQRRIAPFRLREVSEISQFQPELYIAKLQILSRQ